MDKIFQEIYEREKNENTAFVLMLGVLSEKLTEIINLLSENNKNFNSIKKQLELLEKEKVELKDKKFYMPLSAEDYD